MSCESDDRTEVVENQNVGEGCVTPRHKGLVEFIGGGIQHRQQPGRPVLFFIPVEEVQVGQGKQTIPNGMSAFFDEVIPAKKVWEVFAGARREGENNKHDQQSGKPARYN